jgi:hypothetical protein
MTLQAWQPALLAAAREWSDRSDQLDGAETNLAQAEQSTGQLGSRVAPVADAFLATWLVEVTRLRQDADANSQAIREVTFAVFGVDRDTVSRVQQLMPWDQRAITPVTVTGP